MAVVLKHGTATVISTSATASFLSFTPKSSTSWKCIQIAAWRTIFAAQAGNFTGASIGTLLLQVSQTTVAEFRLAEIVHDAKTPSITIPWGDGLSFSGSQQVRVTVTPDNSNTYRFSATMVGED